MKRSLVTMATTASLALASSETKTPSQAPGLSKALLEKVHLKSDLRLRYESIERDDAKNVYRNRYRFRIGAEVDMTKHLRFDAGMRSGFGNPTSGNQTFLDDKPLQDYFFQSLRFYILGLTYHDEHDTVKIGREAYMMYRPVKSQLVWDNDVSLNGVNYRYEDKTRTVVFGVNRPSWEEKAVSEKEVNLFLAQYVQKISLQENTLSVGAGIYWYEGLKGNTPLFGNSKGNTLVDGRYAYDYHLVEGFLEWEGTLFGKPLKTAAGFVWNTATSKNNLGCDLALQVGKAKKVGDWQVKYSYTNLQEDAAFGAYTDSDNFGGGTAARGHAVRAKYKMGEKLYFGGNFFFDKLYESKSKVEGMEPDYRRVQLDVIVKF